MLHFHLVVDQFVDSFLQLFECVVHQYRGDNVESKLGYCFSTHFDNLLFCDLHPCVFGRVGMSFKNDKCPPGVVT